MAREITGVVIVVSDRVLSGERENLAGPMARDLLAAAGVAVRDVVVVPEGIDAVAERLRAAVADGMRVVVTVGGTGVGPRNQTPEATAPLLSVQLTGVAMQVLVEGLKHSDHAGLSRGLVGLTGRTEGASLIVNAPSSRGGVRDTLRVICPLLPSIFERLGRG